MLFSVGTKVRFIHTGDIGVITKILDDTMIQVLLEDDFEIPTAIEDIQRVDTLEKKQKGKPKRGKKQSPTSQMFSTQQRTKTANNFSKIRQSLTNTGVHVAFEPVFNADGTTTYFKLCLVNDTNYDIVYEFVLKFTNQIQHKNEGKIDRSTTEFIYKFLYDDLNNAPSIELELWQLTTAGMGDKKQKTLKIKAKQFFKKVRNIPLIGEQGHVYTVLNKFATGEALAKPKEDLRTYTKLHQKEKKENVLKDNLYQLHRIHDKAVFSEKLDLHIEQLTDDHEKLSNGEKFRLQIKVFENYIDQAVRLGVEKVYIIHGLGKGRLRNEVAKRLITNPYIKSFKNEHHHKYGFGATEVFLD